MSLESTPSHGTDLLHTYQETAPTLVSLKDNPVQVLLSQLAYPNLSPDQAFMKWVTEDAATYRSYIETREQQGESMEIDARDQEALHRVLDAMRPETLH